MMSRNRIRVRKSMDKVQLPAKKRGQPLLLPEDTDELTKSLSKVFVFVDLL